MQHFWHPLAMAAAFGAFTGALFRLSSRPGVERPLLFPALGLLAGIIAYFLHRLLVWILDAPAWMLPLLVILQVWLWVGPLAPRLSRGDSHD